jgi:hypothetical protein
MVACTTQILKHLGLKRSVAETAYLANKSDLDTPETVGRIRELRPTKSLQEIVGVVGGSIAAVERVCKKYDIEGPSDYGTLQSERMKKAWTDEKKKAASVKALAAVTPALRAMLSQHTKDLWDNPEYRSNQIRVQKEIWNRPENRERLAEFRAAQSGRVSNIQRMLYDILTDLKIEHTPEFIIGPYNFDCLAGRFLIECQGDYWHSQEKAIRLDKAKHTYVTTYCEGQYEIKYLWEHEFYCKDKIVDTIKYWFGLNKLDVVEFDFAAVRVASAKADDYKLLLAKYHYLANAGRGGITYGAYLGDVLVGVCVFSPLIRQNIDTAGYEAGEAVELSRLCIHPNYQKKNMASWFVSRCLKLLDEKYRLVISYCDTTFNHNGATYKALNFKQDRTIRSDYWYADDRGWVMHKKTLYDRAKKMSMTEAKYAEQFGYKKVYGSEKLRFIMER